MSIMKCLCEEYGFHPDACAFLEDAYRRLEENPEALAVFREQVELYRQDHLFDHKPMFERLHALQQTTGIHQNTVDLMYMIRLLPLMKENYDRENIPEEYFEGFVSTLRKGQTGGKDFYGIGTAWWFIDFYKLKLFSIGRLQFVRRRIKKEVRCGDLVLPENSYYLDVHIPGGGSLLPELCKDAYDRAAEFFRARYAMDRVVFGCYSWLLSPDLDELLPPSSNILAFSHKYTLAETVDDLKHSHLTFAFGVKGVPEDLSTLPERSSLQRALKNWLLEGNFLRLGKGYFLHS